MKSNDEMRTQYEVIYHVFKERPMTMLDASFETGILRANICRYVKSMKEKGLIQILFKAHDRRTKCLARYYTTDKNLFNRADERQLTLFGEGE